MIDKTKNFSNINNFFSVFESWDIDELSWRVQNGFIAESQIPLDLRSNPEMAVFHKTAFLWSEF